MPSSDCALGEATNSACASISDERFAPPPIDTNRSCDKSSCRPQTVQNSKSTGPWHASGSRSRAHGYPARTTAFAHEVSASSRRRLRRRDRSNSSAVTRHESRPGLRRTGVPVPSSPKARKDARRVLSRQAASGVCRQRGPTATRPHQPPSARNRPSPSPVHVAQERREGHSRRLSAAPTRIERHAWIMPRRSVVKRRISLAGRSPPRLLHRGWVVPGLGRTLGERGLPRLRLRRLRWRKDASPRPSSPDDDEVPHDSTPPRRDQFGRDRRTQPPRPPDGTLGDERKTNWEQVMLFIFIAVPFLAILAAVPVAPGAAGSAGPTSPSRS